MRHRHTSSSFRIASLPGRISKKHVLQTMLNAVRAGSRVLPTGWGINWRWRNKEGGILHEDSFANVINKSRSGFLVLMQKRILKEAANQGVTLDFAEQREAAPDEEAEIEEQSEELAEEARNRATHKRQHIKRKRSHSVLAARKRRTRSKSRNGKRHAIRRATRKRAAKSKTTVPTMRKKKPTRKALRGRRSA